MENNTRQFRARAATDTESTATFTSVSPPSKLLATSRGPWPFEYWEVFLTTAEYRRDLAALWSYSSPLITLLCLALSSVSWTAVDLVGYRGLLRSGTASSRKLQSPTCPIVMIISVSHGTLSTVDAQRVVASCIEVLSLFGIDYIPVDLKESVVSQSTCKSGPSELHDNPTEASSNLPHGIFKHTVSRTREINVSDFLGSSIGNTNAFENGTGCIYGTVQELQDPQSTKVVQLTCRHVAMHQNRWGNFDHFKGSSKAQFMEQPPFAIIRRLKAAESNKIQELEDFSKDLRYQNIKLYNDFDKNKAAILQNEALINTCQVKLNQVQWRDELQSREEDRNLQLYGEVLCAPKISVVKVNGQPFTRDWALIELDRTKYSDWPPKNRVYITNPEIAEDQVRQEGHRHEITTASENGQLTRFFTRVATGGGIFDLGSYMSEDQLKASLESNGGRLLVGKYGPTTGLSIGLYNAYQSVTRLGVSTGSHPSMEHCIIGLYDNLCPHFAHSYRPVPDAERKFSMDSDSGACIWTLSGGKILGMVTSGLVDSGNPTNPTYATSIDCISRDLGGFNFKLLSPAREQ